MGGHSNVSQWTVRPESILEEFRKAGHPIDKHQDIHQLDLEHVDRIIGWLTMKYRGFAFAEGAATGAAGLPGIPVDVVALLTMSLRAIGEYATYCGFDISTQHERLFALNVLGLASSPTDAAKQVTMAQLVRIATDVAKKKTWKDLEQHLFVKVVQQIAKQLGVRLTKAKLAQVIPVVGAGVGGGFNAYYVSRVCDAAYFLYRERLLAEKYGPEIIEQAVKPAESFELPDEEMGQAEQTEQT